MTSFSFTYILFSSLTVVDGWFSFSYYFFNMSAGELGRLIRPVKFCNQIMGVWPSNKKSGLIIECVKYFQLHFMFLVAIFYTVTTAIDAVRKLDDMNEATECAMVSSTACVSFFRFVAILLHRRDVANVVQEIEFDWNSIDPESKQILREKTYNVYRLAKFYITLIFVSFFTFAIAPLLKVIFFRFRCLFIFSNLFQFSRKKICYSPDIKFYHFKDTTLLKILLQFCTGFCTF